MSAFATATLSSTIAELDLECVCHKLTDPQGEYCLTAAEAGESIQAYRQFLQDRLDNPHQIGRPSRTADKAWHAHILHTKKYAADCQTVFGYFLHHTPKDQGCDDEPCNDGKCLPETPPCGAECD